MAENEDRRLKQLALAEALQDKTLQVMADKLDSGDVTGSELATITKFLSDNGWTVDPARIPTKLKNILQVEDVPAFDDATEADRQLRVV